MSSWNLAKLHKPVTKKCPSFRPILDAINTPSYKLTTFLVPIFTPLAITNILSKTLLRLLKKLLRVIVNMSQLIYLLKALLPIYLQKKRLKTVLMICFLRNLKLIKEWSDSCYIQFHPKLYERNVDEIFVIFQSRDHAKKFFDYMNTKQYTFTFYI